MTEQQTYIKLKGIANKNQIEVTGFRKIDGEKIKIGNSVKIPIEYSDIFAKEDPHSAERLSDYLGVDIVNCVVLQKRVSHNQTLIVEDMPDRIRDIVATDIVSKITWFPAPSPA